jgi:threonine dehydrogenase-like Zn-dependent dehydrogenase
VRQAILYAAGDLRLDDVPLDPGCLKDDQVYVETEVTALSTGTDLGNYLGKSTDVPGAPGYPRGVGYSNVGIVRKVGGSVSQLTVGQRVFSMRPHQSAYIAHGTELLVPVPDGVKPEQASLAYLTQLGMAAMRQANYQAGESVAVVGLGVIGLGTIGVARAMGAAAIGVANSELRAKAALAVGAHRVFVIGNGEPPRDVDLVVLTANPWAAYRTSVDMARYGGRVSILGFPGRGEAPPDFNPLDPLWFYGKQLSLIGAGFSPRSECTLAEVRFNLRRNLEYIFNLMAARSLSLESLVTHRLPATRMREAYELAKQHSKDLVAAVFDWRNL